MMQTIDSTRFEPRDTLFLWWLGDPSRPLYVGELRWIRAYRGVSLQYGIDWLAAGFPLSEDLPLIAGEFLPTEKDVAVGAVDDARPDRWGERVIRCVDKPTRLSLMEYLYLAGDERLGALGVSISQTHYLPRDSGPLPELSEIAQVDELVRCVMAGEPVPDEQRRLIAPGATLGGARPKALLKLDGVPWVLKFSEAGEHLDWPLIEHASMTLALKAHIDVAETRPIRLARGHAVAVRRFDRNSGRRLHALSAKVALHAAGAGLGYPELAQLLRRRGVTQDRLGRQQMHQLFRRMVFNILVDNTDDHEKNHVLLMTDRGEYTMSPAFDVLPSGQALGYQQLRVGVDMADATLSNALSEHAQFGLKQDEAHDAIRQVVSAVDGWRAHFAGTGVRMEDIESLAMQIDRPFLADQRSEWRRRGT